MKSRTTRRFWKLYQSLPAEIRAAADRAYVLWMQNPYHPSLHFKRVDPVEPIYSIRITRSYRALGVMRGDVIVWFWIGTHGDYEQRLR
ncbi:MAG TPA: hypothetical protein ENK60_04490 [Anaerolineae bacterium]|nr:hypothetical protein [Anaerolineae bacterium]